MFSINIIFVKKMLTPFFCIPFKYVFNCDSRKISNFEKWLGMSRSLATPAIGSSIFLLVVSVFLKNYRWFTINNSFQYFFLIIKDILSSAILVIIDFSHLSFFINSFINFLELQLSSFWPFSDFLLFISIKIRRH